MTASPSPAVASMDEARLLRLLDERATLVRKLAETDSKLSDLCRRYSRDNGYRVNLTPEQMRSSIDANRDVSS